MAQSVCYFTDSDALGGAEEAMLALIARVDRQRWSPSLVLTDTPARADLERRAVELGVPTRVIPSMPLGARGATRVGTFASELRRERPAIFHAHLSWPLAAKYALASAALARVPAIIATVQLFPDFAPGRSTRAQQRLLGRFVDRYIAVSAQIATRLRQAFGWPEPKVDVIRNGVDVSRFRVARNPELRRLLGGPESEPIIVCVARLHEQKGLDVLLEAAALVPRGRFVLVGDGPERPALERQAAALGVAERVSFLGVRHDVPELVAAADVFVLPSVYEGTSLALLEAMASGAPIVATHIGGTDELVRPNESALLVPPRDPRALADALRRLLGDPGLGQLLGRAARARAERDFSLAEAVSRVTGVYEEVLAA
jgi:glycosyltransferase involved in cell wall biosynthesis